MTVVQQIPQKLESCVQRLTVHCPVCVHLSRYSKPRLL